MTPRASGQTAMTEPSMRQCLDNCQECHRVCVETVQYCLGKGGKHVEAEHVRILLDCAEICATSADFLARGSTIHPQVCGACAEACERCAESCEQFGDDARMKECAEVCRRCAESCRKMAA